MEIGAADQADLDVPAEPRQDAPAGEQRTTAVRGSISRLGRTVLACRGFAEGQTIGQVTGTRIDDPDYESDYCIELDEGSLEPDTPWRWLNHSCEPNCEFLSWEDDDPEQVWLVALRPITAGEELTVDYGWPPESAIPCACRSPRCRGWIATAE